MTEATSFSAVVSTLNADSRRGSAGSVCSLSGTSIGTGGTHGGLGIGGRGLHVRPRESSTRTARCFGDGAGAGGDFSALVDDAGVRTPTETPESSLLVSAAAGGASCDVACTPTEPLEPGWCIGDVGAAFIAMVLAGTCVGESQLCARYWHRKSYARSPPFIWQAWPCLLVYVMPLTPAHVV